MVRSMYYRERPILVPLHTETPSIASARFPPEMVPYLQNVNVTFTGLNCRCNWCVTDMRARCPLGPHVSNPNAYVVKSLKQHPHSRPTNLLRRQLSIHLPRLIAIRPLY